MSSHILFPNIEPNGVPATMSRTIMHGLLRETLGFDGLILSDCMVMDAIRRHYGTAHGVVEAMRGRGHGIRFEQCRSPARERCRGACRRRERLDRRAGTGRVCGAHPPRQGAVDTSRRAGERRACRGLRRRRAHGARGGHCGARQGVPGKRKDVFLRLRRLPHDAGLKRRPGGESVPEYMGARFERNSPSAPRTRTRRRSRISSNARTERKISSFPPATRISSAASSLLRRRSPKRACR